MGILDFLILGSTGIIFVKLKPDLIIGSNDNKDLDKLEKIAPTVTYTYNVVDYLTQHLEIGKLVNKEK